MAEAAQTGAAEAPAARHTVVGNEENRRVAFFADALRRAGHRPPRVLPWQRILPGLLAPAAAAPPQGETRRPAARPEDPRSAPEGSLPVPPSLPRFAAGEVVRLDSPGENPAVDRLLRDVDDSTLVLGGARWYARFTTAVRRLSAAARADGARLLDDPDELAVLFDKRLCHGVLREGGVPVPPSPTSGADAPPVRGWADVRDAGLGRFFVKPAHGSSASGVLAVETAGGGRVRAVTSVERAADGRLHNSLRLRRYTSEREVAELVDALAPDGLHLETWLPKASLAGRPTDLRVVVVGGRATHAVLRAGSGPMTNLHLGGSRVESEVARQAAGEGWEAALRICEQAAALFPATLAVGVDLLPGRGWRRLAVGEVNAFGDLLPGLPGLPGSGAEGLDTYDAQVAALAATTTGGRPARAAA